MWYDQWHRCEHVYKVHHTLKLFLIWFIVKHSPCSVYVCVAVIPSWDLWDWGKKCNLNSSIHFHYILDASLIIMSLTQSYIHFIQSVSYRLLTCAEIANRPSLSPSNTSVPALYTNISGWNSRKASSKFLFT
jgi:hypothetical protein